MLRGPKQNQFHSGALTGGAVDDSISGTVLREGLLDKFELVAKADYDAQIALVENMQAQLRDLEERLEALEHDKAH